MKGSVDIRPGTPKYYKVGHDDCDGLTAVPLKASQNISILVGADTDDAEMLRSVRIFLSQLSRNTANLETDTHGPCWYNELDSDSF